MEYATKQCNREKYIFNSWQLSVCGIFFTKQNKIQALHFSLGFAPQIPHAPPSFFINGLLLLQVPENLPSFFINILIAIPAKAIAKRTMESKMTVIAKFTKL